MRALVLAAALTALAAPAFAATAVTLRDQPVDTDGKVTLGDLFDDAGTAAGVVVAARPGASAVLDAGAVQAAARRAGLAWSNERGLRRIIVRSGETPGPLAASAPTAAIAKSANVEVLTWARSLAAGETVQPDDLVWAKVAAAPTGSPRDAEAVIGMAARRPLRAGAVVYLRDVSAPQAIKAGDLVDVVWSDGQVSLSLQARANGPAAVGETVALVNLASKKVFEAVATGPGQAAMGPGVRPARTPGLRYASR